MTGTSTVAERLREAEGLCETHGLCGILLYVLNGEKHCPMTESCTDCRKGILRTLARRIEAEQRSKTEQNGVDVDALLKLEDTFCHWAEMAAENNDACQKISVGTLLDTAKRIRDAVKGAKPQLPEGVIWPTYEDGELVKFGDEFIAPEYGENEPQKLTRLALYTEEHFPDGAKGALWEANYLRPGGAIGKDYRLKRPEPEVLGADGVPIKVGDTVWDISGEKEGVVERVGELNARYGYRNVAVLWPGYTAPYLEQSDQLTHRKPDTQEAIDADCWVDAKDYCEKYGVKTEWPKHYGKAKCEHLLERQRKLLGGE